MTDYRWGAARCVAPYLREDQARETRRYELLRCPLPAGRPGSQLRKGRDESAALLRINAAETLAIRFQYSGHMSTTLVETPARQPKLELFIDLPNFERALKRVDLPHKIDLAAFGREIASRMMGGPYFLGRVNGFAATDDYDVATGKATPEGHHRAIAQLSGVHIILGHRLRYAELRDGVLEDAIEAVGREKGVDVNLAATMMERACDNRFDAALLISADTDFCGVIRQIIARGKRVYWGCLADQRDILHLDCACTNKYLLSPSLIRSVPLRGGRK